MNLGTKLIVSLVAAIVVIMTAHGYVSIQQDQENVERELRVGMRAFSRTVQFQLSRSYGAQRDLKSTQQYLDITAPRGNIHGIVVYDRSGEIVARSASIRYATDFPELDPASISNLAPRSVLADGIGIDGYIREYPLLIYYRIEPLFDSANQLAGAFVLARQGYRVFASIERRRNRIMITTSILVVLLSLLILLIVRRSVIRPIHDLVRRIREIGEGQWEQRIPISGGDEITALAREFNLMSEKLQDSRARLIAEQQDRLKLEQDLRHNEKLASVGRLAAGLAHEIGTPLNIIGGRAEYLQRRPRSPTELNENLQIIRSQMDRIAGIVRRLLEFSRRGEPAFRPVEIPKLLHNVRALLDHQIRQQQVHVEIRAPSSLPTIQGDPDLLQQVFLNIFLNALDALKPGGNLSIRAETSRPGSFPQTGVNGATGVQIVFEDNGVGIAPEHIDNIFDPFFTTKDVGEGTGLGLSVSYGIVKDHGGEINAESVPGQYTRFKIYLPIKADTAYDEVGQAHHESQL